MYKDWDRVESVQIRENILQIPVAQRMTGTEAVQCRAYFCSER